jgi:hypothetical protein
MRHVGLLVSFLVRLLNSTSPSKSKSKEPQFILEDAIHASESSASAGVHESKPAHVFEVRIYSGERIPFPKSIPESDRTHGVL